MRIRYIWQSIAIALVCVGLMGAAPSPEARFNDLGHKLMCKCGCNQVLLECNHVGCSYSTKMRDQLTAALNRGDNDDLILQGFVQEYGATVLSAPTKSGFNIVAWIMPFIALVAGLALVTVIVRKWNFRLAPAVGVQNLPPQEMDEFRRRAREDTEL